MSSATLPMPWCRAPRPGVQLPRVGLAPKVTWSQASGLGGGGHPLPPWFGTMPVGQCKWAVLGPHLVVLAVSQTPPHTARPFPCPLNVLCAGFTRGAGCLSTPFSHVLLVSCLCANCSTSRGSRFCPSTPSTCSWCCAIRHRASRPRLHPCPSQGNRNQACSSPLGQVGHAVQPAARSPPFLTHPCVDYTPATCPAPH